MLLQAKQQPNQDQARWVYVSIPHLLLHGGRLLALLEPDGDSVVVLVPVLEGVGVNLGGRTRNMNTTNPSGGRFSGEGEQPIAIRYRLLRRQMYVVLLLEPTICNRGLSGEGKSSCDPASALRRHTSIDSQLASTTTAYVRQTSSCQFYNSFEATKCPSRPNPYGTVDIPETGG